MSGRGMSVSLYEVAGVDEKFERTLEKGRSDAVGLPDGGDRLRADSWAGQVGRRAGPEVVPGDVVPLGSASGGSAVSSNPNRGSVTGSMSPKNQPSPLVSSALTRGKPKNETSGSNSGEHGDPQVVGTLGCASWRPGEDRPDGDHLGVRVAARQVAAQQEHEVAARVRGLRGQVVAPAALAPGVDLEDVGPVVLALPELLPRVPRPSVGKERHRNSRLVSWFRPAMNAAMNLGLVSSRVIDSGGTSSTPGRTWCGRRRPGRCRREGRSRG